MGNFMGNVNNKKSDEYYTPKYIFESFECEFDLDVSTPDDENVIIHTPCKNNIKANQDGLKSDWFGFVWMNPPYGDQKNKESWLEKFIKHGNGIALMPDRTSTKWWHYVATNSDCHLQILNKIKFIREDGSIAKQPSNGTTLFAIGQKGVEALINAEKNGLEQLFKKY